MTYFPPRPERRIGPNLPNLGWVQSSGLHSGKKPFETGQMALLMVRALLVLRKYRLSRRSHAEGESSRASGKGFAASWKTRAQARAWGAGA